jgi:hypothetical protein
MDTDRARAIAARLHAGDRDLIWHLVRVVSGTPPEARAVAWLHEALESASVTEHELLAGGLTSDQLRALRLLTRTSDSRSDRVYLAHVELIALAAGRSGELARMVKLADLEDRRMHPRMRAGGWAPPYERGLERLRAADQLPHTRLAVG